MENKTFCECEAVDQEKALKLKKELTYAEIDIKKLDVERKHVRKLEQEITDYISGLDSNIKNDKELEAYKLERHRRRELIDALRIKFNIKNWIY